MRSAMLAAIVTVAHVTVAAGQPSVVIVDRGPGPAGRILAEVLASRHTLIVPDTAWFVLPRNEHLRGSLMVLGRTAAIEGQVDGDIVVVGGDLFLRPASRTGGRAVAIGGGVYPSTLAVVSGDRRSFRDQTFDIAGTATGYELTYRSLSTEATPPLTLPGIYGVRVPTYDRVNGLSASLGPAVSFPDDRGEAELLATYRSDLGKVDPSFTGSLLLGPRLRLEANVGRATLSNDDWIWPDLMNSLASLVLGKDTRNYFRADRAELVAHQLWEGATAILEPFVGLRGERSWAVGPFVGENSSPWSVLEREDTVNGMRRPNPPVPDVDLVSVLGGTAVRWETTGIRGKGRSAVEQSAYVNSGGSTAGFTQVTSDLELGFLTFGDQQYDLAVHWVITPAGTPPPQRFAYLGGSGTLPFVDLLAQGGDELLFIDQRYSVPLPRVRLGALGALTLLLRHRLGSAGLGGLPDLEQTLGAGVLVSMLRMELQLDPATRRTRFSVGPGFAR